MNNLLRHILIAIVSVLAIPSFCQDLKVKSFSMQMEPMTFPMQRKDNNGNICALVKVFIPDSKAVFEGSLIGNCDYKTSEYWCYLSPGSKQLKIKYPGCEPLMVSFEPLIGSGLKSKSIYELRIEVPSPNHIDMTFTIKGEIDHEKPNEKGYYSGEKIPYTPGYTLFKNYHEGNYDGKWDLSRGSYEISEIRIGDKLTLFAKDDRYEPQTIIVEQKNIGNSDFKFFLKKKRVNLKGYLVDLENSEPILGAEVSADNKTWYKIDDYGYFTIENLVIDEVYGLHCKNTPLGYLTYENPKIVPILCSSPYGWGIKRTNISAWVDLNGMNCSDIKVWCNDGHEVKNIQQRYDMDRCIVRHPYHTENPSLILRAKGYKTIQIDFRGYLSTPKSIKFHKGDESKTDHYVVVSKNGKAKIEKVNKL